MTFRIMNSRVDVYWRVGPRSLMTLGVMKTSISRLEVLRVLYSLYVRARGTEEEGRWPNPYERRVTRTRPAFL